MKLDGRGAAVVLCLIVALDAIVRIRAAIGNTNFIYGDALAPISLLDQIYHRESIDLSRQAWLLPVSLAGILRVFGEGIGFHRLFIAYSGATAIVTTLTLPLTYALARRFMAPWEALIPVLLLSINASLFVHSDFPNPKQFYMLLFTASLVALDREQPAMAIMLAALGMLIRWEGALLLVLIAGYLACTDRRWRLTGPLAAILAIIVALGIHLVFSTTPFGFLINTGAVRPAWTLPHSAGDFVQLLVGELNWKFEKLHALAVNMTIPGLILASIGAIVAVEKRRSFALPIFYWFGYEGVMLIFTLILPVGNIVSAGFVQQLQTAPVARYYQVLTPVMCIFAYLGLRQVVMLFKRPAYAACVAAVVLVMFALHQIITARNTYANEMRAFAQSGFIANIADVAEWFRANHVRRSDIVLAKADQGALQYMDTVMVDTYYNFHVFHFSILSGRNRTNCTGDNLDNPNYFARFYHILRWSMWISFPWVGPPNI